MTEVARGGGRQWRAGVPGGQTRHDHGVDAVRGCRFCPSSPACGCGSCWLPSWGSCSTAPG